MGDTSGHLKNKNGGFYISINRFSVLKDFYKEYLLVRRYLLKLILVQNRTSLGENRSQDTWRKDENNPLVSLVLVLSGVRV